MDQLFWGRININATYAHLFFEKDKASQTILFNLKYKNNAELGVHFGREIGKVLQKTTAFSNVDAYIPVPLHPKKEFIRGYNQSEVLTKGICEVLDAKMDTKTIVRTKHSETQTKKSRFQRWDNVNTIFKVKGTIMNYKHIVLVDDVVTTGSTIESIAQTLLTKNPKLSISVVTLAIA
ncbi:MAG: phosphoribosyltransferase family protein [Crocinitomicaceae bacterium]|nr:phosphoribosyltransferase family protein [Crocinitomicaceae bacterium]